MMYEYTHTSRPEPEEEYEEFLDCGHWAAEGDTVAVWCGKRHCADCFRRELMKLPLEELAELVDGDTETVKRAWVALPL